VKHKLYRRTFAKLSLLSGGALLVPSIGTASVAAVSAVTLTAEERKLIETFAEAMLPTEGTALKPRSEVPIADNVARAFSLMDEPILEQVRIGLKLFDVGAIVIGFHFTRFVNLSVEKRLEYIDRWEDGIAMQRGIVDLLKKLTYLGYWQDIEAGRAIGYRGPVSVEGGVPNLGNAPMPNDESDQ
jgi:hypothetical protein